MFNKVEIFENPDHLINFMNELTRKGIYHIATPIYDKSMKKVGYKVSYREV